MNLPLRIITAIFSLALPALAQNLPRIGYVFPAGGRVGTTFRVAVGGQFLDAATNATVSGSGVQASFVDFHKPMNQGVFNTLRDQLRELQDRRQAVAKATRRGEAAASGSTNTWSAADEKLFNEIREKILKNPPNRAATPAIAEVVTLSVTIAADAEPGDRELRLGSSGALSNPLKLCVGGLPEISRAPAAAPNPDLDRMLERLGRPPRPATATNEWRVTPPVVINGQIMPGLVDRYRFHGRRGESFVIAASARELIPYLADAVPGWFQAALTLYDAKGKEVAYNDDFRFHPDPVLCCKLPADGDYVLEVKDAIYRGREDFVYRISLGELPFVTGIYPLGGPKGRVTEIELAGWNLPTNKLAFDARESRVGIQPLAWGGVAHALNRPAFAVDSLADEDEREPNDSSRSAQTIYPPMILNGRIARPGDVDVFRFRGHAGESVVAEVLARRLDSPLDSTLQLTDAQGRQVAFNDDTEDKASGLNTHHADPRIQATLTADGEYCLRLAEAQGKGGAEYAYRLRISAPQPDFALRLVPSAINLRGGGSAAMTIYALRRDGFTNEIVLSLKDAPPGFALSGGKIQAGQDQVKATLSGPAMPADERFHLELEGKAAVGGSSIVRPVVPADDLMQAFFYRHLVPAQELQVSVAGRFGQRGVVKILSPTPLVIPLGGTARVQVAFPRGPFMDQVQFELADPPDGISIKGSTLTRQGIEITLRSDGTTMRTGQKGNLILTASTGRQANRPKAQAAGRRFQLGALPAVPYEVAGEAADSPSKPAGK